MFTHRTLARIVYVVVFMVALPLVGQDTYVLVADPAKASRVCSRHGLTEITQVSGHTSIYLVSSFSPDPGIATDKDVQSFEPNQTLSVPELSGATQANLTQSSTSILDGLPGRTIVNYFGSAVPSNYVQQPATSLTHFGDAQAATNVTGRGI